MNLRSKLAIALALVAITPADAGFDDDFSGATLRVDYYHAGTASAEHLALDRVRVEGAWPGSRTQLIDTTNLGKYLVEVVDQDSNRLLYTRGFCSIYGEWETTGEAQQGTWRAIPEAVRVPEPRRPFQLRIRKRDRQQSFREIWSITVDPASRFVDRAPVPIRDVWAVMEHGDPSVKVDLVVLGDGYTTQEMDRFRTDIERIVAALFSVEPFASHKQDFNVRAVNTPAEHSGISRPRAGVFRNTPLGTRYNAFDLERYVLTFDDRAWRDAAAAAPYDFVLILVNGREYGGGGIHNLYAITAAGSASAPCLVAHEFGHHFAGLADEYYTGSVAYEDLPGGKVEPWEPNVTALLNPAKLKWRELVLPDTPVPTPWNKAAFENRHRESQGRRKAPQTQEGSRQTLDAARREGRERLIELLGKNEYADKVGVFEGAMYAAKGLYRPSVDCLMFEMTEARFCPVCSRAIERIIELYAR